ncbi:unnamed protein product [Calypogeia fissa]
MVDADYETRFRTSKHACLAVRTSRDSFSSQARIATFLAAMLRTVWRLRRSRETDYGAMVWLGLIYCVARIQSIPRGTRRYCEREENSA